MNRAKIRRSAHTEPDFVGSNSNVVAHPNFRELPISVFPLFTERGRQEYERYVRLLFDADRLTAEAHRKLSSAMSQFDNIIQAQETGRPLRASWYASYDRLMAGLKLDDLENKVAAPKNPPLNKFSNCGFSSRS